MNNPYLQLHDYLSQIMMLSNHPYLPKITQTLIAEKLDLPDSSGVSRFLQLETKKPHKMLRNFKNTYGQEYKRWPEGSKTIERVLRVCDALYFLDLPMPMQPKIPNPLHRAAFIAPIAISYRGHLSDKDGAGMLFDHMRIQSITHFPTRISIVQNEDIQRRTSVLFAESLRNHTAQLPMGHPPFIHDDSKIGLLILTGRAPPTENEPVRLAHEYRIIREALNRGQPILGICAGSWRLFEQLWMWTKRPKDLNAPIQSLSTYHQKHSTLVPATDHSCPSGMIRLDKGGVQTSYNVQIHDILIQEGSLLKKALRNNIQLMNVNSVHWKAVNSDRLPLNVTISAYSAINNNLKRQTRQKTILTPQNNSAEAFESQHGVPVMGIQWHPEAYLGNSPHGNLIKYMALAGKAYMAKRKMLRELQEKFTKN